jgi:hypothetical protein
MTDWSDVLNALPRDSAATSATSPRYNEIVKGVVTCGDDEMMVLFHACRGAETAQGVRAVTLTRTFEDLNTPIWRLVSDEFTPAYGLAITSRRA